MKSPLLVVLVRLGKPGESEPYANMLREIFLGPDTVSSAGVSAKELLQTAELREFVLDGSNPGSLPADVLGSAERLLLVVLDAGNTKPGAGSFTPFERDLIVKLDSLKDSRQVVLEVFLKTPGSLYSSGLTDKRIVRLGLKDLDERDLRMPFLVLYALHHSLRLFASASGRASRKRARLFFSHAKRDGVPLTTATRDWMKRLKGLRAFYDTENLDLNGDVEAQLSKAVKSAIVIVFRSDIFDQRYWCQKEVLWAEQFGRPVITVDARWQIEHGPSVISFDSTPAVRIPDGSVVRIFTTALVEALRVELFRARVDLHGRGLPARVKAIPRCPSLVSLHEACNALPARKAAAKKSYIVYPNPALPDALRAAAEGLAQARIKDCQVRSLDEFRLVV
jgi:hypothetical protein